MRCVLAGLLAVVASVISAETIEIRTVADLQSVTNNLGATYELMNDIDLSGVSFEPIGGVDRWGADAFTGTFHGNGHKIVGLKINDTGSYGYVGFFRATSRATITDLQIVGEVSGQNKYCGGLVGESVSSYFNNCVVQVAICGGQYTGGFVGYDSSGSRYVRCVARGTLQIANTYCGGFVGRAGGEYWQCVSSMVASAPKGDGGYVEYGGFVGVNSGATFQDCAATGSLTVKNNNYFGGFVGCAEKGNYYDCYSAVDITLRKGGRTGGFAGVLGGKNNFTRCYVCGTFKWGPGAYDIGGFLGDALGQDAASMMTECHVVSEMDPNTVKTKAAWPGYFTEDGAWGMIEGETLPYLRFRSRIIDGTEKPVYSVSVNIVGSGTGTIPSYLETEAVAGSWVCVDVDPNTEDGSQFFGWEGNYEYENRDVSPTWVKVDRDVCAVVRLVIGIWNIDDLARLTADFNGKDVTLMQDLIVSSEYCTLIGTQAVPYTGTFDGNGHTITAELTYTNQHNTGFFGYVNGATIRNLTVKGQVQGINTVGGVVGCADGDKGVTLEDVTFVGEVKGVNYVGGLIGSSNGPFSATRCAAIARVSGNNEVAGFARYLGNYYTSVSECFAIGTVTATNASGAASVFIHTANSNGTTISNCYAQVDVSARTAAPLFTSCSSKTNNVYAGATWTPSIDTDEHWLVVPGCTPVLRWSASGDKVKAFAFDPAIDGAGEYALGTSAEVSCAAPPGRCFLGWSGAAPYEDRTSPTTTVRMTNHQLFTCDYGVRATNEVSFINGLHQNLSGTLVLDADLDLGGCSWQSVGVNSDAAFKGRLIGNGHIVRGLDKPVFNYTDGAILSNVTFMGVMADQSDYLAGAVRRVGKQGLTMSRVMFVGELHGKNNVGGLVGNSDGPIRATQCAAIANIVGYDNLCGFAYKFYSNSSVNECFAIASITTTNSSGSVSGFVAYANDSGSGITNCYVQAEFHAQDLSRVAPFVRFLSSSSTTNNIYWGTSWPASIDADDHWLVYEGCTPVLKWSAPEGRVSAYAFDSAVSGTGAYALGSSAAIACTPPAGKMFAAWTGSAPYADKTAEATTVKMVNHQLLSCEYGVQIRTVAELQAVTNNLNGLYGLGADIDLTGLDWTPIANDRYKPFRGKFYGKGHRISGLNADAPPGSNGAYDNRGLFGCVEGGTLQGIKVSGQVKGSSNVGGLVGYAKGSTVIENCEVDVDVSGYNYLGGLVGKVEGPVRITGSKARGSVTGCNYLGGFVSFDYKGLYVADCEAWGNVSCTNSASSVGGFIGCINEESTFLRCSAYGDVSSVGGEYGGFMGRIFTSGARVDDCASYGVVSGSGSYLGRFCGRYFSGTIVACKTASNRNEGMPRDYGGKLTEVQVLLVEYDPEAEKGAYAVWAKENGLTGADADWEAKPAIWGGEWANAFIYTYGEGLANGTLKLMDISFDEQGIPVITTAPVVEGHNDFIGVVIGVSTLQDWSNPIVLENKTGESWMLPTGRRANFFKVKLDK